jgi:glycosyltransferase involved in cell wall biosynthesis
MKKIALLPVLNWTTAIFAIGNAAKFSYSAYGYRKPIYKVHYSINNEKFRKILNNDLEKNLLKLKGKKFIFLICGSLSYRKGVDVAIRAYQDLSQQEINASELWIIGSGELDSRLKLLAQNFSGIRFFGFIQPELLSTYFSVVDVLLFPTRYDGWGVVVNEAIAVGKPVIISDAAVASELIQNTINGYVCRSEVTADFSRAMSDFLNEKNCFLAMERFNLNLSNSINSDVMAQKFVDSIFLL